MPTFVLILLPIDSTHLAMSNLSNPSFGFLLFIIILVVPIRDYIWLVSTYVHLISFIILSLVTRHIFCGLASSRSIAFCSYIDHPPTCIISWPNNFTDPTGPRLSNPTYTTTKTPTKSKSPFLSQLPLYGHLLQKPHTQAQQEVLIAQIHHANDLEPITTT